MRTMFSHIALTCQTKRLTRVVLSGSIRDFATLLTASSVPIRVMRLARIVWLTSILAACPAFALPRTQKLSAGAAARFLDQATWGPTPASIAQLQEAGITNWLDAQFALNTSDLPDQPLLASSGKPNSDL